MGKAKFKKSYILLEEESLDIKQQTSGGNLFGIKIRKRPFLKKFSKTLVSELPELVRKDVLFRQVKS